jgi:cytochrome c-type biogenesis protein CcmF
MAQLGHIFLIIALSCAFYAIIVSVLGFRRENQALVASGQHASIGVTVFLSLAIIGVWQALLANDFRYEYVAGYTNRALPIFYKFTALWAGQKGSLLLWGWLLSMFNLVAIFAYRHKQIRLMPFFTAVMMTVNLFFISLNVFIAKPFEMLPAAPPDGHGLNPLLQHWAMIIHPPILYLGYVGFTVPFAFAIAALLSGMLGNEWLHTVRRWTLVPWFFLGIGMLLGGKWAYMELGWGGYWAWDPVENSALMPWLCGTAFLHSVMIQEKKNMLRVWNMVLIICTFLLCIFGTFITRSGVISSVHSFTQSGIGPMFLIFVGLSATFSFSLLGNKVDLLRTPARIEAVVSRESTFLLNNVVFLGACFAVFWGTMFPIISEAVRGVKITVGPPFFDAVNVPIALFLLFLTGVGPLVAWRKSSLSSLKKIFAIPVIGMAIALALFLAFGVRHLYALISFSLGVFVTLTIVSEFHRGALARQHSNNEAYPIAWWHLLLKNKRRYGGYIVHFGMVMIFMGITGSAFNKEAEGRLKKGESFKLRNYEMVYEDFRHLEDANKQVEQATMVVKRDGEMVETIYPQKHFYKVQQQPTTEVALFSNWREDLYVVLGEVNQAAGEAIFKAYLNPLVQWIWIGGLILTLGTWVTLLPDPRQRGTIGESRKPRTAKLHDRAEAV